MIGLKDSGRDMHSLHLVRQFAADRPEFSILVGPEELLAEAVMLARTWRHVWRGEHVPEALRRVVPGRKRAIWHARPLHDIVMAVSTALYTIGSPTSSYFRGLKCQCRCWGYATMCWPNLMRRLRVKKWN